MFRSAVGFGLVAAGAVVLARPLAFPDGPPPGRTGGFGEPTCQVCHADASVVVGAEGVWIESLPRSYVPGETYRLTVNLTREGMGRGGFQVSARYAEGKTAGKQAGTFRPSDSTTSVSVLTNRAVQYIAHTSAGARLTAPDTSSWTFEWRAPADAPKGREGEVIFNVAANAANNDQSEFGDKILIRAFRVRRDKD